MLQDSQSDVMKNLRRASVGEQYHLDKTLEQNIRLQNEITADVKVRLDSSVIVYWELPYELFSLCLRLLLWADNYWIDSYGWT